MISRRHVFGLSAAALALPSVVHAQQPAWRARRTLDTGVAFPERGRRSWADQVPQIRIGLLGGENEADRLGRFGPYRDLIEQTFGVPTRLYPAADYAGVQQALGAGQIEMASMGPAAYAAAWLDTNGGVEPILVSEEADGSITYVSVMVTRADSGITNLEQMKGKSLAWADPNSASGYVVASYLLRRGGLNTESGQYFSRTGFAGGHEQGVISVLQRQYDAAVTWASGQGEMSQGYTRGNLRAMVEKKMLNMNDLRIVWTSDPIINGPIAVRSALPAAFKEDMKLFHLGLPKAHREIYEMVERGSGTGYREVRHDDFQLMVDIRREQATDRRRRT